jgi:hypothetical protein
MEPRDLLPILNICRINFGRLARPNFNDPAGLAEMAAIGKRRGSATLDAESHAGSNGERLPIVLSAR